MRPTFDRFDRSLFDGLGAHGSRCDVADKAISPFRYGLDITRLVGGVVQCVAKVLDDLGQRIVAYECLAPYLIEQLTLLDHLAGMRPPAVKGVFMRKISVSTTMGPGALVAYGS